MTIKRERAYLELLIVSQIQKEKQEKRYFLKPTNSFGLLNFLKEETTE